MSGGVSCRRIYDEVSPSDGARVLVDRVWPRGIRKDANGITFLEGCDPDGGRVVVAYPSPRQLPRTVIADRLHG